MYFFYLKFLIKMSKIKASSSNSNGGSAIKDQESDCSVFKHSTSSVLVPSQEFVHLLLGLSLLVSFSHATCRRVVNFDRAPKIAIFVLTQSALRDLS